MDACEISSLKVQDAQLECMRRQRWRGPVNYSGVCDDRVRDAPALCIGLMLDRDEGCHRRGGFFFCSRGRRREADPAIVPRICRSVG